jgi:hypothetical protein
MALGVNQANSRITTNTDTAVVAAPGAGERVNVRWITIDVEGAGTGSLARVENGAGGDVVLTLDTSDDNNRVERVYHVKPPSRGYQLDENTALNVETTGSVAATIVVNVEYEVTGG